MSKITFILGVFLCLFTFHVPLFSQDADTVLRKKTIFKHEKPIKAIKSYIDFKTFNYVSNFDHMIRGSVSRFFEINKFKQKEIGFFPSFGYSKFYKNDHFLELSFSFMGISNKEIEGFSTSFIDSLNTPLFLFPFKQRNFSLRVGTRFEYVLPILKNTKSESGFYVGISSEPNIFIFKTSPLNDKIFNQSYSELNTIFAITPRYIQNISKNCFIDFNIPLPLYSYAIKHEFINDPILPTHARRKTSTIGTFLPHNYQIRLGLGIKI
jgi:hypothetical protein